MAILIFPHSLKEFSREQSGEGRNWGFGRTMQLVPSGLWKNPAAGSLWAHLIATRPSADCKNNDASERKKKKKCLGKVVINDMNSKDSLTPPPTSSSSSSSFYPSFLFLSFQEIYKTHFPDSKLSERDRETDRQTDRQTYIQTDRQTDRQTGRQTGRQADRQADRQTDRQARTHTDRATASHTQH